MVKTSFTVHLNEETAERMEEIKQANPDFSRNALIRMCILEYNMCMKGSKTEDTEINALKRHINAFHKQLNPDWKRKKSLPYHFEDEYHHIANYTDYHGSAKHE